ncbi:hypothetical protein ANCCEY_15883 [Ancylostoma ceylanicum]|uniref:Uncharacterized protein n=1 Tax=Ancylostoma ceylanicum TaxID=53326 RepID=A0A0D6L3C8_9BILA|nr:hypothetical protein ANCCEY_15883 [Ancylostoma ceylanicum]
MGRSRCKTTRQQIDPEDLKADYRIVGGSKLKKNCEDHGNMKPMTGENLEGSWRTFSPTTKEEDYGLQKVALNGALAGLSGW